MPSHFSTIGLNLESEKDYFDFANLSANEGEIFELPEGIYYRWATEVGAEVWIQVDPGNNLVGMTPHFTGLSKVRVGLTTRVARPDDSPLEGAFYGWADPQEEEDEEENGNGLYPFIFDSPDFRCHGKLELPSIVTAQVAAFAHEVTLFESIEEYDSSQTEEPGFASKSFIPSGLFSPEGETNEQPEPYGIFTGHITQMEKKVNPLSERPFYWLLVDTYGGTYDVVIDPELVDKEPAVGGILTGSFWLVGRLVE